MDVARLDSGQQVRSEEILGGCPFCDWQTGESFPNTAKGRLDALWAGCEHAMAEHKDQIE